MNKIIIAGGSGFLGTALTQRLLDDGFKVVVLDIVSPSIINKNLRFVKADLLKKIPLNKNLKNPYAVINLAGKRILGRWSQKFKKDIYDSRIISTENLVELFSKANFRPKVLISASAAGYYGNRGNANLEEESTAGTSFLAKLARDWEGAASVASKYVDRVCIMRNGYILGNKGIMKSMFNQFKFGFGGSLGGGRQYFPWIALEDAVGIYVSTIENDSLSGVINVVSPEQISNREFSHTLSQYLNRPNIFNVPKSVIRFIFGELAEEILASQKVYPGVLIKRGYPYKHRTLISFFKNHFANYKM